jgi:hypothetical protein
MSYSLNYFNIRNFPVQKGLCAETENFQEFNATAYVAFQFCMFLRIEISNIYDLVLVKTKLKWK